MKWFWVEVAAIVVLVVVAAVVLAMTLALATVLGKDRARAWVVP